MQQPHEPANTEESRHKTTETIEPITRALAIRALCDKAQNDTRQERENNGDFKMIEVKWHYRNQSFWRVAIS
jgi:hypothetical protein